MAAVNKTLKEIVDSTFDSVKRFYRSIKQITPLFLRLVNKVLQRFEGSLSANWFPLLILSLLLSVTLFCSENLSFPIAWRICALGSVAYLLTLAGFVVFNSQGETANASTRTATALAIGAATMFAVYAWGESALLALPNLTIHGGNQPLTALGDEKPLDKVNLFATLLGMVLAAVALIAQKSAADARTEAEKARRDILDALDIRTLALSNQLLERALAAKAESDEMIAEASETAETDENIAHCLRHGAAGLTSMAKFFMVLHHWLLEPRLASSSELLGKATKLILDLSLLNNTPQSQLESDLNKRLRIEYLQPAGRLIETLLRQGMPSSASAAEAEKVMSKLGEVRTMFNQF